MKLNRKRFARTSSLAGAMLILLISTASLQARAASLAFFGPAKFERTAGTPQTISSAFQVCNTGATYKLILENGTDGKDRVSSGTVSLNGVEVIRPRDLNQRVERIEKEVELQGENTLAIRLTSKPGGHLTISLFCESGCLDLDITSPTPGSTVNRVRTLVKGNLVNTPGEVGVVLTSAGAQGKADKLAQVQADLFAGLVPLQLGENTLTATATDACGYQVRKEVTIHTDSAQEKVRLSVFPPSGILGDSGTFETELETDAYLSTLTMKYSWDFDGDGTAEESGVDLVKTIPSYTEPGLYLPTVTVTDAQGKIFKDTAVVLLMEQEEIDALLAGKWKNMQDSLVKGDIDAALRNFEGGQESKYKRSLEKLKGKFAEIFSDNEQLRFVSSFAGRIEYENFVIEGDKAYSYPVIFTKDENGIWKIRQF